MDRIEKVRNVLKDEKLDCMVVDHTVDLFYLTGLEVSLGRLVVTKDAAILFVDGRYYEKCKEHRGLDVKLTKGYGEDSHFHKAAESLLKGKTGFDMIATNYLDWQVLSRLDTKLIPLKSPIKRVREIKDEGEIKLLKESAFLGSSGYDFILTKIKEGVTEEEIAKDLEVFWLKKGADKLSFSPIIAFGPNSAFPHHRAGKSPLGKERPVLIDIGVVQNKYYSDMSRVIFYGKPYPELEKIYFIVKEASERALDMCKPGVLIKDVDAAARDFIVEKGYGPNFTHSLGHGVGLEIHEFPLVSGKDEDAKRRLVAGMVITIEPGIYLPGLGGVRLEDTIVITKNGYESLTCRPLSESLPIIN